MKDKNKVVNIEVTLNQCANLVDFIENTLLTYIRDDVEIDNVAWVSDMCDIYKKFKNVFFDNYIMTSDEEDNDDDEDENRDGDDE